jgi:LCP family protein required for cell wall assembly
MFKSRAWSIIVKVSAAILGLALLLVVSAAVFAVLKLGQIQKAETVSRAEEDSFETDENTGNLEETDPDDVQWAEDWEVLRDKDVVNLLLIGQDTRVPGERARSDSIILITMNRTEKEISLTSFMRDLYVQIPGYSDNRINAAYAYGGMELLDETIEKNFAIEIDGNVEVDFDGFTQVIDAVGGVDLDLSPAEASYLQSRGYAVSVGMNHLDGTAALLYARVRSIGNSDYDRTYRQRKLLSSLFASLKDSSFSEVLAFANELFPCLTTDMTQTELIGAVMTGIELRVGELQSLRIPADDTFEARYIRGMSVLVPDLEANRRLLREELYHETAQ